MKEKADAQSRRDPGASFVLDVGGPVLSAGVAGERNRVSGQELTGEAERAHVSLALKAKERESDGWSRFGVNSPGQLGT